MVMQDRMCIKSSADKSATYIDILLEVEPFSDLAGSEKIEALHIAEAIGYRNLDRSDWAERGR